MPKQEKLKPEEIKTAEDSARELAEKLTPFDRATIYTYLHAEGMDLSKAREIRRAAGALA